MLRRSCETYAASKCEHLSLILAASFRGAGKWHGERALAGDLDALGRDQEEKREEGGGEQGQNRAV